MDYEADIKAMVAHLDANFSEEGYGRLVKAAGFAIVALMSRIQDHTLMHTLMHELFFAIEAQTCEHHKQLYPLPEIDAETFLRDYFQPERTDD